ncbi:MULTISPECIES: class I poly(R)-hydroxyalkanoic acid synthase [unclassified Cocleimonas]|uniref:class I poly(R)-hydroxyalkanoic acid synthase n=1 Tax=unclassified Cocleimonas TaxID=2639732 RepID=UPI002DBBE15F|nr:MULTISPECIES: class I poly(R)-hydroxyalkanoic acid synthase [unclassified Cocleimonas]
MSDSKQEDLNALGFGSAAEEMRNNFKHVEDLMKVFAEAHETKDMDPFKLSEAYSKWFTEAVKNPGKVMQDSMNFWTKSMQLGQQALTGAFSDSDEAKADPVITEEKGDRRFKHDDWTEKSAFNLIKQSYLLTSEYMRNSVSDVEGLDDKTAEKVKFFTERYLDSMSPTNFAATNPAVLEKVIETKGANLVHGLKNMLEDLEEGEGQLKIRMTDTSAFTLGENVATTPGKVVFQNKMFQLIQYTPSTDTVLKRPLLIVPPWINKFYIMDLQPKNSMLKWMVDQGHTVFVVSWINPDETYKEVGFEDYVTEGVVTAVDAVEQATGESEINAIGYCIGGTLLSTSLAYMKANGDNRVKSATFFTTMIDFADPGELGVFIDEGQIASLEKSMEEEGCLKGSKMSGAFNMLRANDLIWSFYVNNYLLGNDPRPFDLLYWNSDSTRMTPTMHSWYLRNMYKDNNLCKPNKLSVKGTPIDISSVDIPVCFISAVEDHIAPWLSTYSGAKLFSGDTRFILGGSGHIAGIINPPEAKKYGYRVTDTLPDDPQAWADAAEVNEGSWWPNWDSWVRPLDNETVKARAVGKGGLKAIEDAPGTYVKCKVDDPSPVVEYTKLDPAKKPKPATAKKTAAKKPATKKAEAKKAEAKKPAAKKVEAKKPEAKKPVAKKPATKKPEVKKAEATKPVSKKAEVKTAEVKKPAAPKAAPAAKAKPVTQSKPAAKNAKPQASQAQLDLKAEAPKKPAAPKAAPVAEAKKAAPTASSAKDDLTAISGVGPKVAEMLNSLGINAYSEIAAMTPKQILEKMDTLDVKNRRFDTSTWPAQAKELESKNAKKK